MNGRGYIQRKVWSMRGSPTGDLGYGKKGECCERERYIGNIVEKVRKGCRIAKALTGTV